MTDTSDLATCWLDPNSPITIKNYNQPPVACGSLSWSSATADRRKVTCWSCAAIIELTPEEE